MRTDRQARAVLDRAVTIHRWDCEALNADNGLPPDPDEWNPETSPESEAAIAYGIAVRRAYDALRRAVGQVAGLLILAQASRQREIADLPALERAREQWAEASEELAALSAPSGLGRHLEAMRRAAHLTGAALNALMALRTSEDGPDVTQALEHLCTAYQVLQSTSESRLGLAMVDFRQSCCNCGRSTAAE